MSGDYGLYPRPPANLLPWGRQGGMSVGLSLEAQAPPERCINLQHLIWGKAARGRTKAGLVNGVQLLAQDCAAKTQATLLGREGYVEWVTPAARLRSYCGYERSCAETIAQVVLDDKRWATARLRRTGGWRQVYPIDFASSNHWMARPSLCSCAGSLEQGGRTPGLACDSPLPLPCSPRS